MTSAIHVDGLRVELARSGHAIVDDVTFAIAPGEVLGLVGESGSGKTTIGTALLGDARRGARITAGSVLIDDIDILTLTSRELRRVRGGVIAYIPQDPSAALNPAMRIGGQLRELLLVHDPAGDRSQHAGRIERALAEVKLLGTGELLRRYPHQLSGGQQQRVCLAMAFLLRPRVIVLDEPTTGLDVTTQAHVLTTLRELCAAHDAAVLYVTHDLAVVSEIASRVMVMYAGAAVELGPTADVLEHSGHPYTLNLIEAIPDVHARRELKPIAGRAPRPGARPPACAFAPRCAFQLPICVEQEPPVHRLSDGHVARCHRAAEIETRALPDRSPPSLPAHVGRTFALSVQDARAGYDGRAVLHGVSFELYPRECLALVGESGSGKTTLSRLIAGLLAEWDGRLVFEGKELGASVRARAPSTRRRLQYVFQSPFTSLNPRKSIGEILETPVRQFFTPSRSELGERVGDVLQSVELDEGVLRRYPHELSGGERQRVAIARALVCEPSVLICDEITSALDVSVQAAIVELLRGLRVEHELAMLFVTHNLALVRTIADRVAVMDAGRIVEIGPTEELLDAPRNAYTRDLLDKTPSIDSTAATPRAVR